jgi:lysylphosphatidylglycerol synthetase-like protein (DUF2156 family)
VQHIAAVLHTEGARSFSLGEVPFVGYKAHGLARAYQLAGLGLQHAYNSPALFAFKHKFEPEWRPLVLASNRRIGLFTLIDLFIVSGAWRLALRQLWPFVR